MPHDEPDETSENLVVVREDPLNCETKLSALSQTLTDNASFYIRSHFAPPRLDAETYRLSVSGMVERPLQLSLAELKQLPSRTMAITLECAGNGRTMFAPIPSGEPWQLGAVGTAKWTGVPLLEILSRAGVRKGARHIVFRGADMGRVEGVKSPIRFERSLTLDETRASEALVAYAMNGEDVPLQHGYPVRLVMPDWYGMASVKWLSEIELTAAPFRGHYQHDKYQYEWKRGGKLVREPVTRLLVRALITEPVANAQVARGEVTIRGAAWSGVAPIARVEIDAGQGWREARLIGEAKPHAWRRWEFVARLDKPGLVTLRARATDRAGRTQPEQAEWNRLGYGNNSVQQVAITIE